MFRISIPSLIAFTLLATEAFGDPTLEVDRTTARPGQLVTVTLKEPASGVRYRAGLYEKTAISDPVAERIRAVYFDEYGEARIPMPTAQGDYYFRLYAFGNDTRVATSAHVVVECPPISLVTDTVLANAGQAITVQVVDGPGNPKDYIQMYVSNTPDLEQPLVTKYLYGQTSVTFMAPSAPGEYNFRLFAHGTQQRLAKTEPVIVKNTVRLVVNPATPSPGQLVTVNVIDGPNNPGDYIRLCPPGDVTVSDCLYFRYLNGSTSGSFIAPAVPMAYEFRMYAAGPAVGSPKLLATQAFSVQGTVQLVVNPATPSPGQLVTVDVVNGPNNPDDYIRMCPSGDVSVSECLTYRYLRGGTSVSFIAPTEPTTYEFRMYAVGSAAGSPRLLATQTFSVQ